MNRGICQGGLPSLPTYNVSADSLSKWIAEADEGYQIGTIKIPDLVYVDDKALITILVDAMQRLLDMVGAWAEWARIEFHTSKCWYFYETYQGRRAIHPDVELTLAGKQIAKAEPQGTVCHLGIPVRLDQLCGSGGRTAVIDEERRFLPSIIQQNTR